MKKLYLTGIVNKYYLNGLTERVKIGIKDKIMTINFISAQKNIVGNIIAPNINIEDCEIGIYDTTQFLKLLNITDKFLTLEVEKKNGISNKLLIADNEYNLEYSLADLMLTPNIPTIEEPPYEMEADINSDFINKFIKARKALTADIFVVEAGINSEQENIIEFLLGGIDGYTNKINFNILANKPCIGGNPCKFPIDEFREILDNNKDLKSGKLFISEQGLLKIQFTGEEGEEVTYYLVGKE
jgi:hypothetical protein